MLDIATDVIPLTAYCEHPDCMDAAFYTYRYYSVDGLECPALFFDPLIVVGGDRVKQSMAEPNYASRCDRHHYLPGKEYTFFTLKPLGESASRGDTAPLLREMEALHSSIRTSQLYRNLEMRYGDDEEGERYMNSLRPGFIAEKALCYLFCEQNLISEQLLNRIVFDLELDIPYMEKTLADNRRPVTFSQPDLFNVSGSVAGLWFSRSTGTSMDLAASSLKASCQSKTPVRAGMSPFLNPLSSRT